METAFARFQRTQELILEAAYVSAGIENLAQLLGRATEDLYRWIAGAEPVSDDTLEQISRMVLSLPVQPPIEM
jgi:hypothetical protein